MPSGFWNQQEEEEQNFWDASNNNQSDFWGASGSTGGSFWENNQETYFASSGTPRDILIFDNISHSGDGGVAEDRGSSDEAANLFRHAEDLGHNVTADSQVDGQELVDLLEGKDIFILPEAERNNVFPDGDIVEEFVSNGGNLVVFYNNLDYLNSTFGFQLDGQYAGNSYLNEDIELGIFADNPNMLTSPSATTGIDVSTLPQNASPVYLNTSESSTTLVIMPYENGNIIYMGWDFYADPSVDQGWDPAYADVLDLNVTGEGQNDNTAGFWDETANNNDGFWGVPG